MYDSPTWKKKIERIVKFTIYLTLKCRQILIIAQNIDGKFSIVMTVKHQILQHWLVLILPTLILHSKAGAVSQTIVLLFIGFTQKSNIYDGGFWRK